MDKLTVRFSGPQGAGVQSVAEICTKFFLKEGYHVFSTSDFESRIIGGYSFSQIGVSVHQINSVNKCADICFSFTEDSFAGDRKICGDVPKYFIDSGVEKSNDNMTQIPVNDILEKEELFAKNIFFLGMMSCITGSDLKNLYAVISKQFEGKKEDLIQKNCEVAEKGYNYADQYISFRIILTPPPSDLKKNILQTGSEAVSFGSVAARLKFFSAYPMSPSTSIMNTLSSLSEEFGIFVEQAEDEIAAINLVLGASYAGARSMTATSGGGLALMSEAISLAAISETPIVIVDAQRPGPATGLPTKTAQQDLSMVLSIGHGEFTRVVLAPGTIKKAFESTQKAFYLADKYQVPVFILTDQYFMDSLMLSDPWEIIDVYKERFIDKSPGNDGEPALYPRYPLSAEKELRRRIPGGSARLVLSDSHIHDELGLISEDCEISEKLTEKLLKKGEYLLSDIEKPELSQAEGKYLLIGWGSTYGVIGDVCRELRSEGISIRHLHFHEIYPLHKDFISEVINSSEYSICIENNATGQLSSMLMSDCSVKIDERILKYNGRPFYFDELKHEIKRRIKK